MKNRTTLSARFTVEDIAPRLYDGGRKKNAHWLKGDRRPPAKMRIPLRTIQFIPTFSASVSSGDHLDVLATMKQISEMPAIQKVDVLDTIGLPYAFDIQLTEGFYMVIVSYFFVRTVLRAAMRAYLEHVKSEQTIDQQ